MIRRAGAVLVTGVVGAVAVDGVRRLVRTKSVRSGVVMVAAWGLRGRRSMEAGAENVWLATGDILAEARAQIGEQAPPPTGETGAHDH
jgi:hypothetical protein